MLRLLYNRYLLVVLVLVAVALAFGGWRMFRQWLHNEPVDFPQLSFLTNISRRDKIVLSLLFVWLITLVAILAYYS